MKRFLNWKGLVAALAMVIVGASVGFSIVGVPVLVMGQKGTFAIKTTLAGAVAAGDTAGKTIWVVGYTPVAADLTIPATLAVKVALPSAYIDIASGKILTVNGSLDLSGVSGQYIFRGSGLVHLASTATPFLTPEMFGGKADNSTDNRTPWVRMCQAGVRDVQLAEGTYLFPRTANSIATGTGSVIVANNIRFNGKGKNKTILAEGQTTVTYSGNLFWLNTDVSAEFNDLTIQGPLTEPTTGSSVTFLTGVGWMDNPNSREVRLTNVNFTGWFVTNIQKSTGTGAGYFLLETRNVEFQAYQCAVSLFAANDIDGHFHAFDTIFWRATIPPGAPGYPFNHVLYIHPHINIHAERCRFVEWWGKFALHHFSGAGKTSAAAKYSRFIDCRFEGHGPIFEQSDQIPMEFTRCYFGSAIDTYMYSVIKPMGVTLRDCTVIKAYMNDAIDGGNLTVIGGTIFQLGAWVQNYPGTWKFVGTEIRTTTPGAAGFLEIKTTATRTVLSNVNIVSDLTGADKADSPVTATSGSGAIEMVGVRARGQWALSPNSGLVRVLNGFTGSVKVAASDLSGLDSGTTLMYVGETVPAGTVRVTETALPDSKMTVNTGGAAQYVTPTRGLKPAAVSSATTVTITYQYDTYLVSGTTAIANILANNDTKSQAAFSGSIKLIATGAWNLANSGNIRPRTTAARTVNEVVTLTYDPVTALWYE